MKKSLSVLACLLLSSLAVLAQKQATGTVTLSDEDDEPASGAYVIVTGTQTAVMTDVDGNFSIEVPAGKTITVSYSGYASQELSPATGMNISLQPDAQQIEEIEVVNLGYGAQRKSQVTGSISSVKSEQLQRTPASGVDQALQGRASGVTVNAGSGQPGQTAEIRVRGIGSANSDNSPIYVVDGTITDNISFLSPNDIAKMEVLKDASATAIYGSRAANGVILITTKSGGKDREATISFNAYWGWQNVHKKLSLMNAKQQAEARMRFAGSAAVDQMVVYYTQGFQEWWKKQSSYATNAYLPANFDYSAQETDWQDAVFNKNAFMHNYHLSIDGSTDKFSYAFSSTYFKQDGTMIGSDYNRFTLRLNTSYQARKWLKIGEHLSFTTDGGRTIMNNAQSPESSTLGAALVMAPWDPIQLPEGTVNSNGESLAGNYAPATNFTNTTNPYSQVYMHNPKNHNNRWLGDLYAEITPIKGLTIRPSISLDLANNRSSDFQYLYRFSNNDGRQYNSYGTTWTRYSTWINDNVVTYARDFDKHSFSVMVGESNEESYYHSLNGGGKEYINEDEGLQMIKYATNDTLRAGDDISRTRRVSAFGRLFYSYGNRYMVTVNFRADATSMFNKDYMWGYFPSTSLGWRINEESWLKDVEAVKTLKLRVGWGQVGNDRVQAASFLDAMGQGLWFYGYVFGDAMNQKAVVGAGTDKQPNLKGRWETSQQWDAGIDFDFWNGKLGGSFDFYVRDTKDMLLYVKAPAQVGNLYDPMDNIGTGRNLGIDLELIHENQVSDFHYSITGNLSFLKNKLIRLNRANPQYPGVQVIDEGYPLYAFYGYEYEGIYHSDEEAAADMPGMTTLHAGDAKFVDQNGDGVINDQDKVVIGTPYPKLTGSLNFECDWKGIDFQIFFQGVYGAQVYNAARLRLEGAGDTGTLSTDMENAYVYYNENTIKKMAKNGIPAEMFTANNDKATIPNPNGHSNNKAASSRFVEDASYLRLKNLTVGYTLPKDITMKAKIQRLRFYLTVNNLLTLTKYSGYDPEVGGGVDYGNYPVSRTVMCGINLDF
ncbi:MAG: TonB-dependent receptor [Paludibacteraceae bacterium]|nr:TonB-dependent receptor [Paludibacteraceae bacterium]